MYVSNYYPETLYLLQDLCNQKYPVNLLKPEVSCNVSHASKLLFTVKPRLTATSLLWLLFLATWQKPPYILL